MEDIFGKVIDFIFNLGSAFLGAIMMNWYSNLKSNRGRKNIYIEKIFYWDIENSIHQAVLKATGRLYPQLIKWSDGTSNKIPHPDQNHWSNRKECNCEKTKN